MSWKTELHNTEGVENKKQLLKLMMGNLGFNKLQRREMKKELEKLGSVVAKPSKRGPKGQINSFDESIVFLSGKVTSIPKTIRRNTRSGRQVKGRGKLFENFDNLFGIMSQIVEDEGDLKGLFKDLEDENPREVADIDKALKLLVDQLGFLV